MRKRGGGREEKERGREEKERGREKEERRERMGNKLTREEEKGEMT